MSDNVVHIPRQSSPDEMLAARRNQARATVCAPPLNFEAAIRLAEEMYDRSSLPEPRNPEAYLTGLAQALIEYPAPIARACCDPRAGVVRHLKYRPEDKDVRDWCDARLRVEDVIAKVPSRPRPRPVPVRPPPNPEDVARVRQVVKGVADRLKRAMKGNTEENMKAQAEEFLREQLREANASFSTPAPASASDAAS